VAWVPEGFRILRGAVTNLKRLAFVGAGAMGESMIRGVLKAALVPADAIAIYDASPERRAVVERSHRVRIAESEACAAREADLVVLAVKPQSMSTVLERLRGALAPGQTALSVAAGVPLARLTAGLDHAAVVRAMPNTPAQVGAGMSVWTAAPAVDAAGRRHVAAVLGGLGRAIEVEDEGYLDMATAVSGSGPGYVFMFLEALTDAGVHVGLPRPVADELARETLIGSGLMARETGAHPAALRNMVTSPGGTTAAGLAALEAGGLRTAVDQAVRAAYEQSRALGETR
jgi:pyrroline-5-carboxylate reductase